VRRTVLRGKRSTPSIDVAHGVTSWTADKAGPERLLDLVRGHWAIENRLHWVRDVTFDEDRSQVRKAHAPHVLATLRNTAIGLIRMAGGTSIASALRHLAHRVGDAVRLIGLLAAPA
jgi:hypothetical protein